jgi:hypothetical protein
MAASLTDVLTALQNGVVAINNLNLRLGAVFASSTPTATGGAPSGGFTSKFTAVAISTTPVVAASSSITRYGILMHNPDTNNAYVYQTGMASPPTSTNFAGSIVIYAGGTLTFPSASFPAISAGFSVFASSGTGAFTVVEFF